MKSVLAIFDTMAWIQQIDSGLGVQRAKSSKCPFNSKRKAATFIECHKAMLTKMWHEERNDAWMTGK